MQATAFLVRSIRQDSRLVSHHALRAMMAAMILYLYLMNYALFSTKNAAGGMFAGMVVVCCYWFLTLVGSIHFSTAIVEEKEEQTLALLKMTGATAFSILAGKSLPRLLMALLFLSVVAPFLILSVTLGGVLPLGLVSAVLSIFCYAVMLSQIGLFAGVVCQTASRAFALTCVMWGALELLHWWYDVALGIVSSAFGRTELGALCQYFLEDWLGWVPHCSLIANLNDTLLSFATLPPSGLGVSVFATAWELLAELIHVHMLFQLVMAAVFFLLSWLLFERCTSRAVEQGAGAAIATNTATTPRSRSWINAVAWKSWEHISGGRSWFWLRALGTPVLVLVLCLAMGILGGTSEPEFFAIMMFNLGMVFFLINLARLGGRVFNQEIHEKTLAPLLMLPRSSGDTVASMLFGLFPAVLAGGFCALVGLLLVTATAIDKQDLSDLIDVLFEPWFWHFFSWVAVTVCAGLWMTTYLRYGGMMISAVLFWMVAPVCCSTSFGFLFFLADAGGGSGTEALLQYGLPVLLIVSECAFCVAILKAVVRRLEDLAAQ